MDIINVNERDIKFTLHYAFEFYFHKLAKITMISEMLGLTEGKQKKPISNKCVCSIFCYLSKVRLEALEKGHLMVVRFVRPKS